MLESDSLMINTVAFFMVRVVGFEPTRCKALEPKSSTSASSAIPAYEAVGVSPTAYLLYFNMFPKSSDRQKNLH